MSQSAEESSADLFRSGQCFEHPEHERDQVKGAVMSTTRATPTDTKA